MAGYRVNINKSACRKSDFRALGVSRPLKTPEIAFWKLSFPVPPAGFCENKQPPVPKRAACAFPIGFGRRGAAGHLSRPLNLPLSRMPLPFPPRPGRLTGRPLSGSGTSWPV